MSVSGHSDLSSHEKFLAAWFNLKNSHNFELQANANFDIKKEEESTSQIVINEQVSGTVGMFAFVMNEESEYPFAT